MLSLVHPLGTFLHSFQTLFMTACNAHSLPLLLPGSPHVSYWPVVHVVVTSSMLAHSTCPRGRLLPSSISSLGCCFCMTWTTVCSCTQFTDGFPKAQSWILLFLASFPDKHFFFEGEHAAIFSGVTPAWGKSSVWIFQVSPSVLCPQSSRLQLPHLVACGFTAEVECSWLNPPSTLCAPNAAWLTGNPLLSPPTRSHSGAAACSGPLSSGWL